MWKHPPTHSRGISENVDAWRHQTKNNTEEDDMKEWYPLGRAFFRPPSRFKSIKNPTKRWDPTLVVGDVTLGSFSVLQYQNQVVRQLVIQASELSDNERADTIELPRSTLTAGKYMLVKVFNAFAGRGRLAITKPGPPPEGDEQEESQWKLAITLLALGITDANKICSSQTPFLPPFRSTIADLDSSERKQNQTRHIQLAKLNIHHWAQIADTLDPVNAALVNEIYNRLYRVKLFENGAYIIGASKAPEGDKVHFHKPTALAFSKDDRSELSASVKKTATTHPTHPIKFDIFVPKTKLNKARSGDPVHDVIIRPEKYPTEILWGNYKEYHKSFTPRFTASENIASEAKKIGNFNEVYEIKWTLNACEPGDITAIIDKKTYTLMLDSIGKVSIAKRDPQEEYVAIFSEAL
jgi:hypothetical protein